MYVTVQLTSKTAPSCVVAPSPFNSPKEGCYPELLANFYRSQNDYGLIGPYLQTCPSTPVTLDPGTSLTVQLAVPFVCGQGGSSCQAAHDGVDTWHAVVSWTLPDGSLVPSTSFDVQVGTPPDSSSTSTTTATTTTTTTSTTTAPGPTTTSSVPTSTTTTTTPAG
jgi:hypothetical protein